MDIVKILISSEIELGKIKMGVKAEPLVLELRMHAIQKRNDQTCLRTIRHHPRMIYNLFYLLHLPLLKMTTQMIFDVMCDNKPKEDHSLTLDLHQIELEISRESSMSLGDRLPPGSFTSRLPVPDVVV